MARILIVEDDAVSANFLQDVIKKYAEKMYDSSYQLSFDVVFSAINALEIMRTRNYEIVITDIMMARMDGWQFIKEIRKEKDRFVLPILVVTAIDGVDISYQSVRNGANDGFAKPLRGSELQRFVSVVFNLIQER